jgi:phosphoglucosamine mutase
MASSGKKLSVLRDCVAMYPVQSKAIKVARKTPIEQTPTLSKVISECEALLSGCGRLLVRYSGTEKKIRLLVEGKDANLIKDCMAKLEKSVENDLQ